MNIVFNRWEINLLNTDRLLIFKYINQLKIDVFMDTYDIVVLIVYFQGEFLIK